MSDEELVGLLGEIGSRLALGGVRPDAAQAVRQLRADPRGARALLRRVNDLLSLEQAARSGTSAPAVERDALRAELAQARADLEAERERAEWPRWSAWATWWILRSRDGATLAQVHPCDGSMCWTAWPADGADGVRGDGGISEAEAFLVAQGRIRAGRTIRPAVIDAARKGGEGA